MENYFTADELDELEELEGIDLFVGEQKEFLCEIIDADEKNKNDLYACTELYLYKAGGEYHLAGQLLDITGDELGEFTEVSFSTIEDVRAWMKKYKTHNETFLFNSVIK